MFDWDEPQASSSGQRPAPRRGNTRRGDRNRGRSSTVGNRGDRRVWGRDAPSTELTQANLIRLFERQRLLNAVLAKQARLAKLEIADVRSTEAELLRQVNEALLRGSAEALGVKNSGLPRNLIKSQLLTEDMIRRSGRKTIGGEPMAKATKPSPHSFEKRTRRNRADTGKTRLVQPSPDELFALRGPLAREFRRAVARGYAGGPQSWLRGTRATSLTAKLIKKGFPFLPTGNSVFDCKSPLFWVVTSHTGLRHNRLRGFLGERLYTQSADSAVLRRQASSVARLKVRDWPLVPGTKVHGWPCFPTLAESWEMMHRGKVPMHHQYDPVATGITRDYRIPTKQVKPGSSVKAVVQFVIGVRADVEVPRKFLGYFRYRWGFLILKRRGSLPKELVAKLVSIWKRRFSAIWLKTPIRYSEALTRMPSNVYYTLAGFHKPTPPRVPFGTKPKGPRRKRQGKWDRLRALCTEVYLAGVSDTPATPCSDKSGGGVRLY